MAIKLKRTSSIFSRHRDFILGHEFAHRSHHTTSESYHPATDLTSVRCHSLLWTLCPSPLSYPRIISRRDMYPFSGPFFLFSLTWLQTLLLWGGAIVLGGHGWRGARETSPKKLKLMKSPTIATHMPAHVSKLL